MSGMTTEPVAPWAKPLRTPSRSGQVETDVEIHDRRLRRRGRSQSALSRPIKVGSSRMPLPPPDMPRAHTVPTEGSIVTASSRLCSTVKTLLRGGIRHELAAQKRPLQYLIIPGSWVRAPPAPPPGNTRVLGPAQRSNSCGPCLGVALRRSWVRRCAARRPRRTRSGTCHGSRTDLGPLRLLRHHSRAGLDRAGGRRLERRTLSGSRGQTDLPAGLPSRCRQAAQDPGRGRARVRLVIPAVAGRCQVPFGAVGAVGDPASAAVPVARHGDGHFEASARTVSSLGEDDRASRHREHHRQP